LGGRGQESLRDKKGISGGGSTYDSGLIDDILFDHDL
jgi:hypothetical protein